MTSCNVAQGELLPIQPHYTVEMGYGCHLYSLSAFYAPGLYRFPGLEMLANGKDIYSLAAAEQTIAGPDEIFSVSSLHNLIILVSAIQHLSTVSDLSTHTYIVADLARACGKWITWCDEDVFRQLRLRNKKVYVALAHFYAACWKTRGYLAEVARYGYESDGTISIAGAEEARGNSWAMWTRSGMICRELAYRLGEGGKLYIKWVWDVIQEMEEADAH